MRSVISIGKGPDGGWIMTAHGKFGGGFSGCQLRDEGHAAMLISRYANNPEGMTVIIPDDYPQAEKIRAMNRGGNG